MTTPNEGTPPAATPPAATTPPAPAGNTPPPPDDGPTQPGVAPPVTPPEAGAKPLPGQMGLPGTGVPAVPPGDPTKPPSKRVVNGEVRIPQNLFKARVQREANKVIADELGLPLAEAKAIIANSKAATDEASKTNAQIQALQAENARLTRRLDKSQRATKDWEKKHKTDIRRMRDAQIRDQVRIVATSAGVRDVDYAMHLFIQAAAKDPKVTPEKFFGETLKASSPFLYTTAAPAAPAPLPEVPAGTAPPESAQPGGATPQPTPAGGPPRAPENVDALNHQDFASRTRAKYGYSPGAM